MYLEKKDYADQMSLKEREELEYGFELIDIGKKIKNPAKEMDELKVMIKKIGFTDANKLGKDSIASLREYIRIYHLNIEWYINKIRKVTRKKNILYTVGIVLIILIPISIFALTKVESIKGTAASSSGAIITMFLTIILGLYKVTSQWFGAKKFEGLFWEASAKLKNRLYALEDTWIDKLNRSNTNEFFIALEKEISEGRKIVQEETQSYFDNFTTSIIDVSGTLLAARNNASTLFQSFQSPKFKEKLEKESRSLKNELKSEDNAREVKFLERKQELIISRIQDISEKLDGANDDAEIKKIIALKEILESELEASVHQILLKKAESVLYE
ncbi:hypothetical protein [Flavivirga spongiicola]|uniref:SMODS and SLOG-associating 2TM effector domain-containing protein n=1 Tax=Flavivirga spongiicola TaxID=421621 RepID=A0ABU7XYQ2_9FLAO|nr:hypothetical protein [Flavivirga sp. MEBiC05379]MDO5980920.1 hypothetical protein [Flavivirga sp. MEBiC05379]